MEKKYLLVKNNIILIISIMTFMFTLCFVLYSTMNKNEFDINTTLELKDGNDVISKNLEGIIPTSVKIDKSINTAYQNSIVTYRDIDNDIYLLKAYKLSNNYNYKDMNNVLKKLYGNSLFIINNSFNVNGTDKCVYDSLTKVYNCTTVEYTGILYDTYRKIDNVSISNNEYFLNESVIFYSFDYRGKELRYNIYNDSTYNDFVISFTASDISKDLSFDQYIEANFLSSANIYRSKFLLIKNNYQWINTERLK